MSISWTEIHNETHQFTDGVVDIDTQFEGNVLAIACDVKPEYQLGQLVIGYLYQHSGLASRGYAIRSGKDIIGLEVGESDKLVFVPTPYLNTSYG
ncbi:hypothetical protein, partial [Cylindrospermopsis raciborskii]|uniref:hypothetical protein n=1 Tax=Cylindrospermopsis raciborskii TaxID=77022 RepID=UPI0022CB3824